MQEVLGKYLDPITDFSFKKLFGTEANKDLLIDFLNAMLQGKENIKDLTYQQTERLGIYYEDRRAIFDLYCENDRGEKFTMNFKQSS